MSSSDDGLITAIAPGEAPGSLCRRVHPLTPITAHDAKYVPGQGTDGLGAERGTAARRAKFAVADHASYPSNARSQTSRRRRLSHRKGTVLRARLGRLWAGADASYGALNHPPPAS